MPKYDATGPPSGSRGSHTGQGGGKGYAPGQGVGLMAGGQKGLFNPVKIKKAKKKK